MLFWNMVLGHFLNKIRGRLATLLTLSGLMVLSYVSMDVLNILCLGRAIYFAPVFYVGLVAFRYREVLQERVRSTTFLVLLAGA